MLISHIEEMSRFANEKFTKYQTIWVKFDEAALIFAILTGISAVLIQVSVSSQTKVESEIVDYPIVSVLSIVIYSLGLTGHIDLDFSAVLVVFLSIVQT